MLNICENQFDIPIHYKLVILNNTYYYSDEVYSMKGWWQDVQ